MYFEMSLNTEKLQTIFGTQEEQKKSIFEDDEEDEFQEPITEEVLTDNLPSVSVRKKRKAKPISEQDIDNDIDYSIQTQTSLIESAQRLVELALENASNGGTARDVEVATESINTASTAVEKLIAMHEKIQKLKSSNSLTGNTFVQTQNNIIYSSTAEALRAIKEAKTIEQN